MSELNISELLNETYTTTPIQVDKKTADGAVATVNKVKEEKNEKKNHFFVFLAVQFNSERQIVVEGSSRAPNYRRPNVPNLQSECSRRSR